MKSLINIKDYRNEKIDIEIKINELKENFNGMSIEINKKKKLQQLEQVVKLIPLLQSHPTHRLRTSLIMEDEHLDTISKTESDKEYKSSVEDLNLTPSESEDLSDIESKCHQAWWNDDYDSKGKFFLEELLSNDSPSFPENESFHFDVLSSPRPPVKPPDDRIYFEPDMGLLTAKVGTFLPWMFRISISILLDQLKIAPDYEDPRARGFVHHSLELQSFA
ncbi:hypothetical protein Tco_0320808 [Tanacetum coccineum]